MDTDNKCVACGKPISYPNKGATRHECPPQCEASRKGKVRSTYDVKMFRTPTYIERLHLGMALNDDSMSMPYSLG
jgi:hypothetical protein